LIGFIHRRHFHAFLNAGHCSVNRVFLPAVQMRGTLGRRLNALPSLLMRESNTI
jgi:hypothetical protein